MDQKPKNLFKVERIIALKRYEQPPPGYFHLLPDRIIHRIERAKANPAFGKNGGPTSASGPPWLMRWA